MSLYFFNNGIAPKRGRDKELCRKTGLNESCRDTLPVYRLEQAEWNLAQWESIRLLRDNLENHRERLSPTHLGAVAIMEGTSKGRIGRRLMQTGVPWRLLQANRMASICSVLYSDQWKHCW